MPGRTPRERRKARLSLGAGIGFSVCALLALTSACTTMQPQGGTGNVTFQRPFSHATFDAVLQRHVNVSGQVNYEALRNDPSALDRYYTSLTAASPDSHPELFPNESSRLAYWINAYNASVLVAVLAHFPIDTVRDVRPPIFLFFFPRMAGFFLFQRIILGEDGTSFYALENFLIRKRFSEPRIHFALNCASTSCPRLPRKAFTEAGLEAELEREARRFVAESRNVDIDLEKRRISLSSIFDWYEKDFLIETPTGGKPTLERYIEPLLAPEKAEALRACSDCEVVFVPFDWSLNTQ